MNLAFWRRTAPHEPAAPPSEQELLIERGLAWLRGATVREVMTPRVNVVALGAPVLLGDVAAALRRSGRSHYPVYRDDLDHLLGVLFVKDLLSTLDTTPLRAEQEVTTRIRDPYLIPESRLALEVLAEMRRRRRGFAVVVDEYGGFAGVLTINDLVSELVGDLHDEYDRSNRPPIVRIDPRRHLVDGSCPVDEVREQLHCPIPEGDYVTFAGYLLDALGRIPDEGDIVQRDGWTFRVSQMDGRRISQVVVETPSATLG